MHDGTAYSDVWRMRMMRMNARFVIGTLLVGGMCATTAHAQDIRALSYDAILSAACNVGCTKLTLGLSLTGAQPTDDQGAPVPHAISALEAYLRSATFRIYGPNLAITGVHDVTGAFTSQIDNSATDFATLVLTAPIVRYSSNAVGLTIDLAPNANVTGVSASGLAYVNWERKVLDANGRIVRAPSILSTASTSSTDSRSAGPYYQTGDFAASMSLSAPVVIAAVPEPPSYTLLATGLAAFIAVGVRRRIA
jgi:hypothetical protein